MVRPNVLESFRHPMPTIAKTIIVITKSMSFTNPNWSHLKLYKVPKFVLLTTFNLNEDDLRLLVFFNFLHDTSEQILPTAWNACPTKRYQHLQLVIKNRGTALQITHTFIEYNILTRIYKYTASMQAYCLLSYTICSDHPPPWLAMPKQELVTLVALIICPVCRLMTLKMEEHYCTSLGYNMPSEFHHRMMPRFPQQRGTWSKRDQLQWGNKKWTVFSSPTHRRPNTCILYAPIKFIAQWETFIWISR